MSQNKAKIIQKINNAINVNATEDARRLVERDLKRFGTDYEYYFYLALTETDLNEKLKWYSKSIELNSEFLDAYINRGLVRNELKDFKGSIEDYDKAISIDKKCALAYNNRGYTKYLQKNYRGALDDYNKAILLSPKFKMALNNKASMLMEVCIPDAPDFSEKYYTSLGITDINEGSTEEGIKNLKEALTYNSESDIIHFYLGVAYHSLGKDDQAIDEYSRSIELNKKMTDAYFNRGQILLKSSPKEALDDFVKAVVLDPDFIDAYYSIAVIQKNLGQYENAIKNLDKIIEKEPMAVNAKALKKLILTKYLNK